MIHRLISRYHGSNTFIIDINHEEIIVIDSGDPDISYLNNWITNQRKSIKSVFLTHEHADHCAGVDELYKLHPFQLFCSQSCANNIRNSKQNFSFYIDIIAAFEVNTPPSIMADGETIELNGHQFTIVETPGHSPGSVCVITDFGIFTGDTILNGIKTPLTFPHSNRKLYSISIEKILGLLKPGMMIYPGHGESFVFHSKKDLSL